MFWKIQNKIRISLRVRLILIITLVAVLVSLVVYGLLLGSLMVGFMDYNESQLDSRLLTYWAIWEYGGMEAVWQRVQNDLKEHGVQPFLFIQKDAHSQDVKGMIPAGWDSFDLDDPALSLLAPGMYLTLNSDMLNFSILLTGAQMDDGTRILIGTSNENREFLLHLYQTNYPVALAGIIVAGIIVGIFASRNLQRSIRRLNREIDRIIVTGELNRRLDNQGTGDEFGELINRYNRLLDRVCSLIESMRNTLDAVAHDIRTPLTRLRGNAELALKHQSEIQYRNALGVVVEQTDQIVEMLNLQLDISEAEQGMLKLELAPCDLRLISGEIVEMYDFIAEENGQKIVLDATDPVPLIGDAVKIRRIMGNIVDNAVKYNAKGGTINIRCYNEENFAVFEVLDNGPGIEEKERERVFERCYRGDTSRGSRGLGLGLSIVKALLEAHKGTVEIENHADQGAIFRVKLPNMDVFSGNIS